MWVHDRAELALSVGHAPTTAALGAGVRQGLALSLWPPSPRWFADPCFRHESGGQHRHRRTETIVGGTGSTDAMW